MIWYLCFIFFNALVGIYGIMYIRTRQYLLGDEKQLFFPLFDWEDLSDKESSIDKWITFWSNMFRVFCHLHLGFLMPIIALFENDFKQYFTVSDQWKYGQTVLVQHGEHIDDGGCHYRTIYKIGANKYQCGCQEGSKEQILDYLERRKLNTDVQARKDRVDRYKDYLLNFDEYFKKQWS